MALTTDDIAVQGIVVDLAPMHVIAQSSLAGQAVSVKSEHGVGLLLCTESAYQTASYDNVLRSINKDKTANAKLKGAIAQESVIEVMLEKATMAKDDSEKTDSAEVNKWKAIVSDALELQASDVHFLPSKDVYHVYFRVHGIATRQIEHQLSRFHGKRVISAGSNLAKNKAGLSDSHSIEDLSIDDLKVKTSRGIETVTVRVGNSGSDSGFKHSVLRFIEVKRPKSLTQLGLSRHTEQVLKAAMASDSGVVIVVGPTGHGKSTTLYSLYDLISDNRMVQLICDPVEASFQHKPNFVMKSVKANTLGRSYRELIKSGLRQDPDVMGIAEMRDSETALQVFKGALTSHLMGTTYHAGDPFVAIMRLLEDGTLNRSVLAETTRAIASQRLIPTLCTRCAVPVVVDSQEFHVRNEHGCEHCFSGAVGRTVVDEVLEFSPDIQEAITDGLGIKDIKTIAVRLGYESMQEKAHKLTKEGVICPLDAVKSLQGLFTTDFINKVQADQAKQGAA